MWQSIAATGIESFFFAFHNEVSSLRQNFPREFFEFKALKNAVWVEEDSQPNRSQSVFLFFRWSARNGDLSESNESMPFFKKLKIVKREIDRQSRTERERFKLARNVLMNL